MSRTEHNRFCSPGNSELVLWHRTISAKAEQLEPPKLTIRVFFACWSSSSGMFGIFPEQVSKWRNLHVMGHQNAEEMRRACRAVLLPLKSLIGLAWLFVHFQDPLHLKYDDGTRHDLLTEEELAMEQFVMGSEYDPWAAGKAKSGKSDWMKEHEMIASLQGCYWYGSVDSVVW